MDIQAYFYVHQKLEAINNLSIISEDDLSRQFVYIRLQAILPLIAQDGNISEALQESRKNVSKMFSFRLTFLHHIFYLVYTVYHIILHCRLHLEK